MSDVRKTDIVDLTRAREERELGKPTTITITYDEDDLRALWHTRIEKIVPLLLPETLVYLERRFTFDYPRQKDHEVPTTVAERVASLLNEHAEAMIARGGPQPDP